MKLQIFFALIFSTALSSQPNIHWQKTLGGNQLDFFSQLISNPGGFSLVGSSYSGISGDKTDPSRGEVDWWLVSLDGVGDLQGQKTIGGSNNDGLGRLAFAINGNYMLAGTSDSNISGEKTENSRGLADFWIMELEQMQNIVWQKTLGGNSADGVESTVATSDGGYLIVGSSNSGVSGEKTEPVRGLAFTYDFWIMKVDVVGMIEWQKTIGGGGNDFIKDVAQTTDGGYILAGQSASDAGYEKSENSRGNNDYWVLKIDVSGNIQWQRTLGGTADDLLTTLSLTSDGGCLVGGYSNSPVSFEKSEPSRGGYDYWIIKLDFDGEIEWEKTIGGSGGDFLYDLIESADSHYILAGSSDSPVSGEKNEVSRGLSDFWIVKVSSSGEIIWQKTLGGDQADVPKQVLQLADFSLLIGGDSRSGISGEKTDICRGETDYWVVKLEPDTLELTDVIIGSILVFPNPTSESIIIRFEKEQNFEIILSDLTGKIFQQTSYANISQAEISINGQSGLYFLSIELPENKRKIFKVVKE